MRGEMKFTITLLSLSIALVGPARAQTRSVPADATYISREEIERVNESAPGTDRNIRVVDIGTENFAVGIVRRGKTVAGVEVDRARPSGTAQGSCGRVADAAPVEGMKGGITHDVQAEGYYILSGSGTMFTGGKLVNGRKFDLTELNGPTCVGMASGAAVRPVKQGDVIIIPAGVVHGWWEVADSVVYLSFRPSPGILTPGWINPVLRPKQ